jgi:hypothetical protein
MRISSKHVLDHYAIQNQRKTSAAGDSRTNREKVRETVKKARDVFGTEKGESFADILKGLTSPHRH